MRTFSLDPPWMASTFLSGDQEGRRSDRRTPIGRKCQPLTAIKSGQPGSDFHPGSPPDFATADPRPPYHLAGHVAGREGLSAAAGQCEIPSVQLVTPRFPHRFATRLLIPALLAVVAATLPAQDPPAEGDTDQGVMTRLRQRLAAAEQQGETALLTRLAEIGTQLGEMKQSALSTVTAVEQMKRDIEQIKQEVATLKRLPNAAASGGTGLTTASPLGVQPPSVQPGLVITATELAEAYQKDAAAADKEYRNNFLTVVGRVDQFTSGSTDGDIMVQMKTAEGLPRIKFFFNRDVAFLVEVRQHEGRIVWSETKTTLLQLGQQLVISGTCTGRELDVLLTNCRIEGLPKPPTPTPRPATPGKATPTPRPRPTPAS